MCESGGFIHKYGGKVFQMKLMKNVYIYTNKYVCDKINKIAKISCELIKYEL